jgi:hypothetical protein
MLRSRRPVSFALLVALIVCLTLAPAEAQNGAAYSETEVKAAFLYHFCSYVQWPAARQPDEPVTIAVLGADAVAMQLMAFLPGRRIEGRNVDVRRLRDIDELQDDELLFIGSEHNPRLDDIIAVVGPRPVLIVTDAPEGLASGAMVNFQLVDERVRFEISLAKAQESGLMLSSRLLSAALRVETSSRAFDDLYAWPHPLFAARGRIPLRSRGVLRG